ncbi:hypothetical protein Tco_1230262 [Tanacetum coccineum]
MDWLSKRKFVIVCYEKVVRIPLEGDEILRVHGERTQGVMKTLMNTMSKEEHEVHLKLVLESLRKEKLYAKFSKYDVEKIISVRDAIGFEYYISIPQGKWNSDRSVGKGKPKAAEDHQIELVIIGACIDTLHVSNLKKCLADANLHVPLDEI